MKRRAQRFLAVDRLLDRLLRGPSRLAPQILEQVEVVEGSPGDPAVVEAVHEALLEAVHRATLLTR